MNNKIWIFIIYEEVDANTIQSIFAECQTFVTQWTSHDASLKAKVELYKNRLIIFQNDEDFNPISGCATDKLFHFIQSIEKKYNVSLLNRRCVVFENEDNSLQVCDLAELNTLIQKGILKDDTIIYNTAVTHSSELNKFKQKLAQSWVSSIVE